MNEYIKDKEIMIIGITGTLGKELTKQLIKFKPHGIRGYSRDEFKQFHLQKELKTEGVHNVSFLLGDVRDEKRLIRAMDGVDLVFHTAAMKQIEACNNNPLEAVKTNINGIQNVITAAMNRGVKRVMFVSTDKAVEPLNLYGASKLVGEKLFLFSNVYHRTLFSCCRYGNVLGSRGSVIPLFKEQAKQYGKIFITHEDMTRFWIKIEEVAGFLIDRICNMLGGEIFVPKMRSDSVLNLAYLLYPNIEWEQIGVRLGEKMHETLISSDEAKHTIDKGDFFEINYNVDFSNVYPFRDYYSGHNTNKLDSEYIKEFINNDI